MIGIFKKEYLVNKKYLSNIFNRVLRVICIRFFFSSIHNTYHEDLFHMLSINILVL